MSSSTTTPNYGPDEPTELIRLENASFAGNIVGSIFYGIVLVLFFQCAVAILGARNTQRRNQKYLLLVYVFWMFALGTVFTAMNVHQLQRSYIGFRLFPGGPVAHSLACYSTWRCMIPNAAFILANWCADALLMYRCYVIYNRQLWALIFPAFMFAGSVSMGIITIYQASQPGSNLWAGVTVNFGLPYFVISVSLNIILTALISFRLLQHSRDLNSIMHFSSKLYTRVVTMLVESCALYAMVSILFISTYAAQHYTSDFFLPMLSQVQIIAPYLIILRVANQRSVTSSSNASRSYKSARDHENIETLQAASNPVHEVAMTSMANGSYTSTKPHTYTADVV